MKNQTSVPHRQDLMAKIGFGEAVVGIIGLGYVGLPLAREFLQVGFRVMGFDIDPSKVESIDKGRSYIPHIASTFLEESTRSGALEATADFARLSETDAILICVPTPIDEHNIPDLSYVVATTRAIAERLRPGQLVVLESTTYPGTTEEEMLPILAATGLKVGEDYFLGYSPEREDPGNPKYRTSTIPKVVSGVTPRCLELTKALYSKVVVQTVPVSSTRVAEATKLLENIYRAVNIALVNELKIVFERMGIDVWEVIEASATKPFGFTPFYPSPGFGGHCIPVDPFYLSWKAHEYDVHPRFVELAGELNMQMPYYVIGRLTRALGARQKSLPGSHVLLIGVTYKPNVADLRESASLKLIDILIAEGARVDYHDPHVPVLPATRKYRFEMRSIDLTPESLAAYDAVLIATDHANIDYRLLGQHAQLVIDTRNAMKAKGLESANIVKA
jgi:UDP-N-acetyl-D-glucosamine dehydrogenase